MSAVHTLLEFRVGRDNEESTEAAVQLFAALPALRKRWWDTLLGRDETLSFEIIVENQTIFFQCFTPLRLVEYIKSILAASYPEISVSYLEFDPIAKFITPQTYTDTQSPGISAGALALKTDYRQSLKTYKDFSDIDPIAPLLSTLSQLAEKDQVAIQYLVNPQQTHIASGSTETDQDKPTLKEHSPLLNTGIAILTSAETQERSKLLLETIATAYSAVAKRSGNSLVLRKPWFFKRHFISLRQERSNKRLPNVVLSLEEIATLYHLPNNRLSTIPNIAWGKRLLGEPPDSLPIVSSAMDKADRKHINVFAETTYKNQQVKYGLQRKDRRRHLYVIGKTGTGKSTMLANMAINDLKNDEGMCVIDPHGDLIETILDYIPSRRINDVVYFDPSDPQRTVQLNLFEGENVVHRELIASGIVSVFKKLYSYSWGPRLEYILRNALLTLLKLENSRMSDILELLTNEKFRAKALESLDDDPILKSFWVDEYNKMQDRQRTEAIASILNKVGQFVSSPLVRDVVNARKSSFSIEDTMNSGKILLCNLSQGKLGEDNAALLGAMLITKIQLAAMTRVHIDEEKRRDFYLYVDEFQNFATESFIKILSEARKYRLNLTLANQYIAQIPEEVQKAIFGNCGSMVSFVLGAEDAALFSKEFSEQYSQDDLISLNRYQIINRISIDNILSRPFPGTTLPLASSNNQNRDKVVRVSRERYAKSKK